MTNSHPGFQDRPTSSRAAVASASPAWFIALFLAVTFLLSLGNHRLPLIDRDEPRFAEASREMRESGNWVVPTFNNAPRYDKPPLIYWMQAAAYRLLGEGEHSARLPAVLCTAATATLLALWGCRLGNPKTGFMAAGFFTLCPQIFVHGRAAVADGPMVLCVLAAAWIGWEYLQQTTTHRLFLAAAFWTTLAIGFLAKGPIAWIPIGMVAWLGHLQARRGVRPPGVAFWIGGMLWMLLLVGLWGVPALIQSQGEFAAKGLGKHVVGRSLYAMESHGAKSLWGYLFTLPFYFLTFFLSFAPWAFWTPRALQFHRNQPSDLSRYLLCGVLLTFVLFTLSRTKLPHYTLPCFPFIALLLSLDSGHPDRAAALRKALGWTGAIFVAVPLLAFGKIQSLSVSDAIVERLEDVLPPEAEVALVDYQEPSLIWDLRRTLRTFPKTLPANEIASWLAQPGPRCCILSDAIARTIEGPWIRREAAGWNLAKGRRIRLVALTPPPNEAAPPRQPALAPPITPPKPR